MKNAWETRKEGGDQEFKSKEHAEEVSSMLRDIIKLHASQGKEPNPQHVAKLERATKYLAPPIDEAALDEQKKHEDAAARAAETHAAFGRTIVSPLMVAHAKEKNKLEKERLHGHLSEAQNIHAVMGDLLRDNTIPGKELEERVKSLNMSGHIAHGSILQKHKISNSGTSVEMISNSGTTSGAVT